MTRAVRYLDAVSSGLPVLEKTQERMVTFFKWLKDAPRPMAKSDSVFLERPELQAVDECVILWV